MKLVKDKMSVLSRVLLEMIGIKSLILIVCLCSFLSIFSQTNLALNRPVNASSIYRTQYQPENAVDGIISDPSRWLSSETPAWFEVTLGNVYKLGGVHVYSGYGNSDAIKSFKVQFWVNNNWQDIPSAEVYDNTYQGVPLSFDDNVEVITDRVRLYITESKSGIARLREITIWEYSADGIPPIGTGVDGYEKEFRVEDLPKIFRKSKWL